MILFQHIQPKVREKIEVPHFLTSLPHLPHFFKIVIFFTL